MNRQQHENLELYQRGFALARVCYHCNKSYNRVNVCATMCFCCEVAGHRKAVEHCGKCREKEKRINEPVQ